MPDVIFESSYRMSESKAVLNKEASPENVSKVCYYFLKLKAVEIATKYW